MPAFKYAFYEGIKVLHEYQIGNEYFYLLNGKIVKGKISQLTCKIEDSNYSTTSKVILKTIEINITVRCIHSSDSILAQNLFNTREEAAEQFLKDNDVPSELLKVLRQDKPKTTVGDLIERIQQLPPSIDLAETFNIVLNTVVNKAIFDSDEI